MLGATYEAPLPTFSGPFTDDSDTKLLLHFDNAITDDNSSGRTAVSPIFLHNNGAYDSTIKKFGSHSVKSNGIPGGWDTGEVAWLPGTGDFTHEFWLYPAVTAGSDYIAVDPIATGNMVWFINTDTGLFQLGRSNVAWDLQYTHGALSEQWYHLAWVRTAGSLKFYLNGEQKASASNSANFTSTFWRVNCIDARMDEFRASSVARYTSNFIIN